MYCVIFKDNCIVKYDYILYFLRCSFIVLQGTCRLLIQSVNFIKSSNSNTSKLQVNYHQSRKKTWSSSYIWQRIINCVYLLAQSSVLTVLWSAVTTVATALVTPVTSITSVTSIIYHSVCSVMYKIVNSMSYDSVCSTLLSYTQFILRSMLHRLGIC